MSASDAAAHDEPGAAAHDEPGAAHDELGALLPGPRPLRPASERGPLAGLRVAVKDLLDVAGLPTGAGTPRWAATHPVPERDAAAVERVATAGAAIWAKAVTDELAYSLSGTDGHHGTPRNVRAPGCVTGGSSSGSAAAVAGGLVELALGTDTGGSVRVPASYCGVVGVRPTWGRVRADGVVPLAPSFDVVGWFAPTVVLAARAAPALLGPIEAPPARPERVLLCRDALALADAGTAEAVRGAAHRLGLPVTEGELGDLAAWRGAFRVLQGAEAWAAHGAWIEAEQPDLRPAVAARFAAASRVTAEEVRAAGPVRAEVAARIEALCEGGAVVLALPATPGPAYALDLPADEEDAIRAATLALTCPAGLAGAPSVCVPAGEVGGRPVGLALVGPPEADERLLALAARLTP